MSSAISPLRDQGYFLHRSGAYVGPFSLEELAGQMAAGSLRPQELVQVDGTPFWQPARVVLADVELENADRPFSLAEQPFDAGATAPSWTILCQWLALRLRGEVENPSAQVLAVLLATGCVAIFCSAAPWLFWLPWFLLTLTGGLMLMIGSRKGTGLLFALAAIAIPVILHLPRHHAAPVDSAGTPIDYTQSYTDPSKPGR